MKRLFVVSVFSLVVLGLAASAAATKAKGPHAKSLAGTIGTVDMTAKSMTVKDSAGKDNQLAWNDATQVNGEIKEGAKVQVKWIDRDGKMTATSIAVANPKGKKAAGAKAPAKTTP